ncbi:MAG: hypothetical protein CMB31_03195 [Euryarchaeota archaeon]|nr:hypothetical protein [Euryarchaeota archaeon]
MRLGIFGTGAIGVLLTYKLIKAGHNPFIYSRGESFSTLQERGIIVHSESSIDVLTPIEYSILNSQQSLDIAIICCKQNSVSELTIIAEKHLVSDGFVIAIQNGLGHLNRVASVVGRGRTIGACITHGSNRIGPAEIKLGGEGRIIIGPLDKQNFSGRPGLFERLIEMFDDANLSPVSSPEILPSIWEKLLLNLAINPISAICGVRNGVLLSSPLNELAISVMMEGATVAELEGIQIDFEKLQSSLNEVLISTAENRCSMLQDVMNGIPTEVDWICGAIVERAEIHGVPVPRTQTLWDLVRGLSM